MQFSRDYALKASLCDETKESCVINDCTREHVFGILYQLIKNVGLVAKKIFQVQRIQG